MFSLQGKVTVITGGTSGIGRAAAERFRRADAEVVIAARTDGAAFAAEIGATFIKTDVSIEDEVRHLMDQTAARFGRIDVCINNAGIFAGAKPLQALTAEEMRRTLDINALGPFYGMKHASKHMRRGGVIINTSSIAGMVGTPGFGDYTAAKFALHGISRTAALEFGPLGIRVNCVCPAAVITPLLEESQDGKAQAFKCRTLSALDAVITADEVAALMHFLAADDCPTITGQEIVLDGGMSAGFSVASTEVIMQAAEQA